MAERIGLLRPIYRGDALTLRFTHRKPPITSWTLKLYFQTPEGKKVLTKTATVDDAGLGKYSFAISAADTKTLAATTYDIFVRREDSGNEITVAVGQIELITGA